MDIVPDQLLGLTLNSALGWTFLATFLTGIVRGFAGFGAAMVFIPSVSMLYGPQFAVATLFIIDVITPLPMIPKALREFEFKEVLPISIGATLTVPFGILILKNSDPTVLRYVISISILLLILAMATGWRYHGKVTRSGLFGLGTISGIAGGIASLYGPPLILFWMSRRSKAATIRANIIIYFAYIIMITGIGLWLSGLLTNQVVKTAIMLIPLYACAIWIGANLFRFSSEEFFRKVAYTLITIVAVSSLPIWQ